MPELFNYVVLFILSAASSFINMMSGGGSLLTIGFMIIMGVDPSVANGTNRIGVLFGAGSGAVAFKNSKISEFKQSLLFSLCAIPGAIIGSFFSVQLSDALFQRILGVIMILVLISMFIPKKKKVGIIEKSSPIIYPAMFLIGFYGGFIQVGVGFLLMAAIRHLLKADLLKTNMHKTFVVLLYTIPAIVVFGINQKIDWLLAIILSVGNALGAWISVKIAIKKGEGFIKIVMAVSVLLLALKLIFI